jgi:hypothetical protein
VNVDKTLFHHFLYNFDWDSFAHSIRKQRGGYRSC